jgi:prevent-host-death family protein
LNSWIVPAILALMLVATITEAKNRLSALIDHVRSGESVLIVDRGTPVARLESAVSAAPDGEGRIARLERAGTVRAARKPPATDLLAQEAPSLRPGVSAVAVLLEERREGR